jgi:hypothetical protein
MILNQVKQEKAITEWVLIHLSEEQKELLFFCDRVYYTEDRVCYIFWLDSVFMSKPGKYLGAIDLFYTLNFNLLPEEIKNDYYQKLKSKIQTYDKEIKKAGDWVEDAEKLYRCNRYISPNSKINVPSFFYEKVKKWNDEWQITDTRLSFYDWCFKTKRTTGEE